MQKQSSKLAQLSPEKRELVARMLKSKTFNQQDKVMLKAVSGEEFPVSYAQEALLEQISEHNYAGGFVSAYEIGGKIDEVLLEESYNGLIDAHKMLRVSFFKENDRFVQRLQSKKTYRLIYHDLGNDKNNPRRTLLKYIQKENEYRFDLKNEILCRLTILRISARTYYLISNIHRLLTDSWSNIHLTYEFLKIYRSLTGIEANTLKSERLHYTDYACWEREWLNSGEAAEKIKFWKNYLTGAVSLNLRTDYPRSNGIGYAPLFSEERNIDPPTAQSFKRFCEQSESTVYTGVLAVLFVLLKFYSSDEDICIGTSASLRKSPETIPMIGHLLNDITFRVSVKNDLKITDFLKLVKKNQSAAQNACEIPRQIISRLVHPGDDDSFFSLHRVFCLFSQNEEAVNASRIADAEQKTGKNNILSEELKGLSWKATLIPSPVREESTARDLILSLYSGNEIFRLKLWYNSSLFKKATIEKMLVQLEKLLFYFTVGDSISIGKILSKIE